MPKGKITLSADEMFKDNVEVLGKWYLAHGIDVEDKRRGGVSLSATLAYLVQEKLEDIGDEEITLEEEIEELKTLYPECVIDGRFDVDKFQQRLEDGLVQGWHDAMSGKVRPLEEVLAEIDES